MKLHDYQEYAVKFIEEHPISALLLDMGLGKTLTTLTAVNNLIYDLFEISRVLVIASSQRYMACRNRKVGTSEALKIQRGSWYSGGKNSST